MQDDEDDFELRLAMALSQSLQMNRHTATLSDAEEKVAINIGILLSHVQSIEISHVAFDLDHTLMDRKFVGTFEAQAYMKKLVKALMKSNDDMTFSIATGNIMFDNLETNAYVLELFGDKLIAVVGPNRDPSDTTPITRFTKKGNKTITINYSIEELELMEAKVPYLAAISDIHDIPSSSIMLIDDRFGHSPSATQIEPLVKAGFNVAYFDPDAKAAEFRVPSETTTTYGGAPRSGRTKNNSSRASASLREPPRAARGGRLAPRPRENGDEPGAARGRPQGGTQV